MPLASKILFVLSILSLIGTVIYIILNSIKYKKEMKAYKIVLGKLEKEEARRQRLAKEAEVIRRFNEMQRQSGLENKDIQAEHFQA